MSTPAIASRDANVWRRSCQEKLVMRARRSAGRKTRLIKVLRVKRPRAALARKHPRRPEPRGEGAQEVGELVVHRDVVGWMHDGDAPLVPPLPDRRLLDTRSSAASRTSRSRS